jgi:beta-galactosidase/beta-glucuronidase
MAEVILNGIALGTHRGGYESFSYDITDFLRSENDLVIAVWDDLPSGILPYGKQREKRGGMWYTPINGIWQTVWIESLPVDHVREITVKTEGNLVRISVDYSASEIPEGEIVLSLEGGEKRIPLADGVAEFCVEDPILWSPETPHLYEFSLAVGEDRVTSYFALRTVEVQTVKGTPRLCLNGTPYFFPALLDQGYYPDGIFTPATPEGYERDILTAKRLGFNMLRKHIKTEPEIFYYLCDRLGMAVFQDMINNDGYSFLRDTALPTVGIHRRNDRRMHRRTESREAFLTAMRETVERVGRHPSVVYWTIFNEGWGQFDHASAYEQLRALDNTRPIDSVSGWFLPRQGECVSDVDSVHVYFKPLRLTVKRKPLVLSEFGGYVYKLPEHSFNPKGTYGYRFFKEREAFEDALERLYREEVLPAVRAGLSASVYTQLSDVEDETNGLMTYDRRVVKVSEERMRAIAEAIQKESM